MRHKPDAVTLEKGLTPSVEFQHVDFSYDGGGLLHGGIKTSQVVSLVSLFFLLPFSNDYELLMNYYELIYDDYE